ncbi:MAG: DUF3459 domain-containing protein, partial [Planctomycetota bacterium]
FLSSQAVMLALRGMPAPYFHSLIGTTNDTAGYEATGKARRINRRKYERGELDALLAASDSTQRKVFNGYKALLAKRIAEPAFHPDASQTVIDLGNPALLAFDRVSLDENRRVLVVANVSETPQDVTLPERYTDATDLISANADFSTLEPGQTVWLI